MRGALGLAFDESSARRNHEAGGDSADVLSYSNTNVLIEVPGTSKPDPAWIHQEAKSREERVKMKWRDVGRKPRTCEEEIRTNQRESRARDGWNDLLAPQPWQTFSCAFPLQPASSVHWGSVPLRLVIHLFCLSSQPKRLRKDQPSQLTLFNPNS